jgi:transcriptional regulator with XRE-family HTH domain
MPMPALPFAPIDPDAPALSPVGQELLRDALRRTGMTVTALAVRLGVSRKHLSNVLNGHAPLGLPLMQRLCEALRLEPELLLCLLDDGAAPRPDPVRFMPGWIAEHGDLTAPMDGWETLEG